MLREGLGDMMGLGWDGVAQLVWNWASNLGLLLVSKYLFSVCVKLSLLSQTLSIGPDLRCLTGNQPALGETLECHP